MNTLQFEKGFIVTCPKCRRSSSSTPGFIRNYALEQVIESLSIRCSHSIHECKEYVPYLEDSFQTMKRNVAICLALALSKNALSMHHMEPWTLNVSSPLASFKGRLKLGKLTPTKMKAIGRPKVNLSPI
ncbi:hypothetical protein ZIOFF_012923 [Zingiber officinale]|uniref:Uncharacterized protein n=1 Tax=Zingiber officinale TaxID=94328 RepID=A0A8J5HAZ9_ZINOF|nr:hypothetical protein ZIOFF_012923 [Zingiber officinale]